MMPGRLVKLLISAAIFAMAVRPSPAADSSEDSRIFAEEIQGASAQLMDVCRVAWQYDNLRPVFARAMWPQGTVFNPSAAPVIHLSPGCEDYRRIVGEMAYWNALYGYGKKCLADDPLKAASATLPTTRSRHGMRRPTQGPPEGVSLDADARQEIFRLERELVYAKANYSRACAWAWPYSNLRPLAHMPGVAETGVVNPLIPVPGVILSTASPDAQQIIQQLSYWEAAIRRGESRVKELLDHGKAGEAAVGGTKNPVSASVPAPPPQAGNAQLDEAKVIAEIEKWGGKVTDGYNGQTFVNLNGAQVTDAALEHLGVFARATRFTVLDIKNSNVTDAGLKYVTGLTGLQWLYLHGSKVTYQGAMQIKRALPHCNVMR